MAGDGRSDAPRCYTPRHAMSQLWGHEPGTAPLPDHVREAIRRARRRGPWHPRVRHGRRRRRLLVALVVVLVVAIAGVGGGYGYARMRFGQIASVDVPSLKAQPAAGKPFNLLVVGSDTRQGLNDGSQFGQVAGQRADVLILVHIVPATHSARLLSIPRDLYVPIAGTDHSAKINAAFDRGPNQLVDTIQRVFGVPINHYLLVNFDGFRNVVDALGGVDLDFPVPVRDWENGRNNSGLDVRATGCRHVDGAQALALARSRYLQYLGPDGAWHYDPGFDLGRIRRQQTFLRVLATKALGLGLANPLRANAFVGSLVHSLTKDRKLTIGQAVRLAGEFRSFDPHQLVSQTIPTTVAVHQGSTVLRPGDPTFQQASNDSANWEQILLPEQPSTRRAVASFLGESAPTTTGGGSTSSGKAPTPTTSRRAGAATTTSTAPSASPTDTTKLPFWDPRPC
jgi:LCP family protein required for cell wall assembly